MNLAVLIFLKTYVCKHELKHKRQNIEPKPTQKNWHDETDIKTVNFIFMHLH